MTGKTKKTRFHSLMTYATEKQFQKVIGEHASSIRAFCYIIHDKDESVKHIHAIIRTYATWTPNAIERWFKGLTDEKKQVINTFDEPANDLEALVAYLTHNTVEAKEAGKYQYSRSDIKDFGIWDILPETNAYDGTYRIVNDILLGVSYRTLVIRYGRDFVYHWQMYMDLAAEIRAQEGYAEAKMYSKLAVYGKPPTADAEPITAENFEKEMENEK